MDFEFDEKDYKTIYCPWCGRKVGKHHVRSTINKYFTCKKCDKEVMYDCVTMETYIRDRQARNTSSGVRF